ncbi:hypothetical protein J6590_030712 [Homalodisca vitripennis]|nr:hypothetical protein J6590_030712 [Homalodisca vitripennis]
MIKPLPRYPVVISIPRTLAASPFRHKECIIYCWPFAPPFALQAFDGTLFNESQVWG